MSNDNLPPRVLAVDPGHKRVGLAVSDPFGNFAVGLDTIATHPKHDLVGDLAAICRQYDVAKVLIGLPLHMSGDDSERSQHSRTLAAGVAERLQLPVELVDERFTSKIAEQSLREQGIRASKRREQGLVDQAAAMRLLQEYLDHR